MPAYSLEQHKERFSKLNNHATAKAALFKMISEDLSKSTTGTWQNHSKLRRNLPEFIPPQSHAHSVTDIPERILNYIFSDDNESTDALLKKKKRLCDILEDIRITAIKRWDEERTAQFSASLILLEDARAIQQEMSPNSLSFDNAVHKLRFCKFATSASALSSFDNSVQGIREVHSQAKLPLESGFINTIVGKKIVPLVHCHKSLVGYEPLEPVYQNRIGKYQLLEKTYPLVSVFECVAALSLVTGFLGPVVLSLQCPLDGSTPAPELIAAIPSSMVVSLIVLGLMFYLHSVWKAAPHKINDVIQQRHLDLGIDNAQSTTPKTSNEEDKTPSMKWCCA